MKKIAKLLPVLMVVCMVFTSVYANIGVPGTAGNDLPSGDGSKEITGAVGNIWATVISVVQVLAIAAVVFAGLRYMFASADQKADIKKSMGTLAIGAVLVFGASTVLQFVSKATEDVL